MTSTLSDLNLMLDVQVKGKAAADSMELGELGLKQNFKLMMMGR